MSGTYILTLEGLDELQSALNKKTNLAAVKTVVKADGARLQNSAQRNAPVDTGTLMRSIDLNISDGGLTATSKAKTDYAAYVEFGTRFMDAQPYMRPALNVVGIRFKSDLMKLMK